MNLVSNFFMHDIQKRSRARRERSEYSEKRLLTILLGGQEVAQGWLMTILLFRM